jgi:hypothetical protein
MQPVSRAAIRWAGHWHKKLIYISDAEFRSKSLFTILRRDMAREPTKR